MLGRRATSREEFVNHNLEASKSKRTNREYYELREVPTAGQSPNEANLVYHGSEKV